MFGDAELDDDDLYSMEHDNQTGKTHSGGHWRVSTSVDSAWALINTCEAEIGGLISIVQLKCQSFAEQKLPTSNKIGFYFLHSESKTVSLGSEQCGLKSPSHTPKLETRGCSHLPMVIPEHKPSLASTNKLTILVSVINKLTNMTKKHKNARK